MSIAALADIHANLTALDAVLDDLRKRDVEAIILLGDMIDYGPRPNETVERVKSFAIPVKASIWGNHEFSLFGGGTDSFSTDRGRRALQFTASALTTGNRDYLNTLAHSGMQEFEIEGGTALALHGTWDNPFWGEWKPEEFTNLRYARYDYVFTGHSHIPHYFESFFPADNQAFRDRKRTVFINPGSVGQPRNHCPHAQYGLLDPRTGAYEHVCVPYDIHTEQSFYGGEIDDFYKIRLKIGI